MVILPSGAAGISPGVVAGWSVTLSSDGGGATGSDIGTLRGGMLGGDGTSSGNCSAGRRAFAAAA